MSGEADFQKWTVGLSDLEFVALADEANFITECADLIVDEIVALERECDDSDIREIYDRAFISLCRYNDRMRGREIEDLLVSTVRERSGLDIRRFT